MGTFLGWASYDLNWYCPYCEEEYDPEYANEHEHCKEQQEQEEE